MKILIVANYAKEHINKFHLSTIKRFKELGWRVDVACKKDADIPYCDRVIDLPIERSPFRLQSLRAFRMLRQEIERERYDVVHCHTFCGKILGILAAAPFRKNGVKVVYTSHGLQYYKGAPLALWLAYPLDYWLSSKVDLFIALNREDYGRAKCSFPAKVVEYCSGAGLNVDRFNGARERSRDEMRASLNIPLDAFVMIYVAELNANKNQAMLIRMFERVRTQIKQPYLLLVGPDHSEGGIERSIRNVGLEAKIRCLGWRSDVSELIKMADVAVASSLREGFGINIIEAMYCRVPVVASNNRGHRETIEDGVTGYLIPPNDDRAMAERVLELYHNPGLRTSMVEAAIATLDKFYDENVVNVTVDLYHKHIVH